MTTLEPVALKATEQLTRQADKNFLRDSRA